MWTDHFGGSLPKLLIHSTTILVGATIGWGAPRLFTSISTSPAQNLSIFPVYVDVLEVCAVDRERLAIKAARLPEEPDGEMRAFLEYLSLSKPKRSDVPFRMLHSLVPPTLAARLEQDRIVTCDVRDLSGRRDFVNTTVLKVVAAAEIRDSSVSSYIIDRTCTLQAGDLDLRMTLSVSDQDIQAVQEPSNEPPTLMEAAPITISGGKSFYLQYDSRFSEGVKNSELQKLVAAVNKSERYRFQITCTALRGNGGIPVGGDRFFTFVGRRSAA